VTWLTMPVAEWAAAEIRRLWRKVRQH
jgi:hypothetical protein